MPDSSQEEVARKAKWFQRFSQTCHDRSPLYSCLALSIADDPEILRMSANPRNHPPHILLAAVHYLLLKGRQHPLAGFYPSVSGDAKSPEAAYPAFRDFCFTYSAEIQALVESRLLQTNEVGRCSYLYLAFGLLYEIAEQPLALLEIGTAAGLNLVWDNYAYQYDNGEVVGNPSSAVFIRSELRGSRTPAIPSKPAKIAYRAGVDLNPIDLNDTDEVLWLRSLLWPEQKERANRLLQAIEVARQQRPTLIRGDGLAELPGRVNAISRDAAVCVFHTHSIHTWSEEKRDALAECMSELASQRRLFRLSTEWLQEPFPELSLTSWDCHGPQTTLLARCDDHGRWVEWLA